MSSRTEILAKIRKQTVPPVELPSHDGPWIHYDDPAAQFETVLTSIGGNVIVVNQLSEINGHLQQLPEFTSATKVAVGMEGLDLATGATSLDLTTLASPQDLAGLDFAILPGEFPVAENGAVWVTDKNVTQRAVFVAAEHLALVVSARDMVDNMHQAYERIEFGDPYFGIFIAGPSKTADIEQSLVIGAQGPRSMTVFLVVN